VSVTRSTFPCATIASPVLACSQNLSLLLVFLLCFLIFLLFSFQDQQVLFVVLLVVLSTALWKFDELLPIGIRRFVRWAKDNPWFVD
jgi:hypothetical protein